MLLFRPSAFFENVPALSADQLIQNNIRGLILDADNTLTVHGSLALPESVAAWLKTLHDNAIGLVVISNNSAERVRPLAEAIGAEYIAKAGKPRPRAYKRAAAMLGLPKERILSVGDQIFTDTLGGNLAGIRTVLVKPIDTATDTGFIRFKRFFERLVMIGYKGRNGTL